MDNKVGLLVAICFVLIFSSLGSAVVGEGCARDLNCDQGEICDETQQSVFDGLYLPTCQNPPSDYICGRNSTCTTNDDCLGYGKNNCGRGGLCVADTEGYGYFCRQDQDCGSDRACIGYVCTYWQVPDFGYRPCNFDYQCESEEWCNSFYTDGFCQRKKVNGISATYPAECESNYVWNGVCSSCNVDTQYGCGEGYFCDNQTLGCSFGNTYGGNDDYGSCVEEGDIGDPCWGDVCCLSGECVDGVCVQGGVYIETDEYEQSYCDNLTYSLTSYWIDGVAMDAPNAADWQVDSPINYTNLNILLGYDDLRPIRHANRDNYYFYGRKRDGYGGSDVTNAMFAYLYSNSTGDMCYVSQLNETFFANCFESCLSSGIAYNISATAGDKYGTIWLTENDSVEYPYIKCVGEDIAILGVPDGYNPTTGYGMAAFTNFNGEHGEVLSFFHTESYLYWDYYTDSWNSHGLDSDSASSGWGTSGRNMGINPVYLNGFVQYSTFGGDEAFRIRLHALHFPTGTYHRYSDYFEDYLESADFREPLCCAIDADCPDGFECVDGVCVFVGVGTFNTIMNISNPNICLDVGDTMTFNVWFYEGTNIQGDHCSEDSDCPYPYECILGEPICVYIDGELVCTDSGTCGSSNNLGNIYGAELSFSSDSYSFPAGSTCTTAVVPSVIPDDHYQGTTGCIVVAEAEAYGNGSIKISFAGDEKYAQNYVTTITPIDDDCSYLDVFVYDQEGTRLRNVEVAPNGGLSPKWTDFFGEVKWANGVTASTTGVALTYLDVEYCDVDECTVTLNYPNEFILPITFGDTGAGEDEYTPPDGTIDVEIPGTTGEIIDSQLNIMRGIATYWGSWMVILVILVVGLLILYQVIVRVGLLEGKPSP